jgi:hypothetical protein
MDQETAENINARLTSLIGQFHLKLIELEAENFRLKVKLEEHERTEATD